MSSLTIHIKSLVSGAETLSHFQELYGYSWRRDGSTYVRQLSWTTFQDGFGAPFKSVNSKLGLPPLQRTLLTIEVCGAGPLGGVSKV